MPDRRRLVWRPWFWLAPAVALLVIYLVYPTINTIYLSFLGPQSTGFVGVENYLFALTSPDMLSAFRNNLLWLIFFTLCTVTFGLIIAVLFDRVRYETAVKALIFLPMAISYEAAGVIWKLMYEFEPAGRPQTGTVNAILVSLIPDFEPQAWLVNQSTNNAALIAIGIWMWTGFCMVILSAGLKSIPVELMEAARVDGANEWQIFRGVTIPLLRPTIAVVTTTMVINVLKVFDIVYIMTNGNLGTEVIANRMYKEMFNFRHFGRASTIAVILLLAVIPVMYYNIERFREQEALR
ncbi:MAG: sugar ABC transporter permease [Caldilineaceae bacterium]|nr:sugar ABC transporter permease [Caldilineaceae bacterium]